MNKFLKVITVVSLSANLSYAMQNSQDQPNITRRTISYDYLRWINQVASEDLSKTAAPDFISPECTKKINGKTVAKNLKEIIAQMHKAKEDFGSWLAYDFSVIDGVHPLTEARFKFTTPSGEGNRTYVVSARLKFDYGKISSIEDIHALVEVSNQ